MTEKSKSCAAMGMKPVPMKLFATWEVDRTPPNCIPRLCSLTLTRLILLKSLGSDISSITIAVKMQGSKRTLRSNEIVFTPNSLLDTELQLSFSLQYPHFLKRDGNKLHIMLQRRKKYKNRTILGYKTLAEGSINMSQVLQRQLEMDLDLVGESKESKGHNIVLAKVSISALSSQPVDHEENSKSSGRTVADFSDEEEDFSSGNEDGEVEGSDSEPIVEESRRSHKSKMNGNVRQRNLKQKFISLLKRFRVNEELQSYGNDQEAISRKLSEVEGDMDGVDIEDLIDELEDLSDSGPEIDTMSIGSTPKPSLRPFFSSSRSLLHDGLGVPGRIALKKVHHSLSPYAVNNKHAAERKLDRVSDESSKKADSDSHPDNWTDSDPSPPKTASDKKEEKRSKLFSRDRNSSSSSKSKKHRYSQQHQQTLNQSDTNVSRNVSDVSSLSQTQGPDTASQSDNRRCIDQLNRILPPDDSIPDALCLISISDQLGSKLAAKLQEKQYRVVTLVGPHDTRTVITYLVNKMQKYCTTSPKPPAQIKLLLSGPDCFINTVLRYYTDQLSFKSPDWIMYIKFYVVPVGSSYLCRYLGSIDSTYCALFLTDWKEQLENVNSDEACNRIQRYMQQANSSISLPVAEAMLTCKDKSSNEDSSQIFIPFIVDAHLGSTESSSGTPGSNIENSVDGAQLTSPISSGSSTTVVSPSIGVLGDKMSDRPNTPPNSPNINCHTPFSLARDLAEPLELQLDYWLAGPRSSDPRSDFTAKKAETAKSTQKACFKSLHIARLTLGEPPAPYFSIMYTTKEKKQKIMRLGKKKEKERESDTKYQVLDGVVRLICSPRAQNVPLTVNIDGNEWTGVKFFQLSAQWQTHVRHFPITLFNTPAIEGRSN